MADSLKTRVARVIAGGVHALVDQLENQAPLALMEQALREAGAVITDVRHELGLRTCSLSIRGRANTPSGGLRRCGTWPCLRLWAARRALHPIGEWAFARLPAGQ